jgi:hypothetical protein
VVIKVWFAVCCEVIMYTKEELASMVCTVWLMVMLQRCVTCIRNDTPCIDCQTERHLKESITAYANTGVLHIYQAPGNGQELQPLRRRKMISTL